MNLDGKRWPTGQCDVDSRYELVGGVRVVRPLAKPISSGYYRQCCKAVALNVWSKRVFELAHSLNVLSAGHPSIRFESPDEEDSHDLVNASRLGA